MKTHKLIVIPLLVLGFASHSHAILPVVLYDHNGQTDPTIEGWSYLTTNTPPTTSFGGFDGGTPAWFISNSVNTAFGNFRVVPTGPEIAMAAGGWSLQVTLRVTGFDLQAGGSMMALYRDGSQSYQMHFGTDGFNTTIDLVLAGGNVFGSYTNQGGSVYNTFELLFDSGAGVVQQSVCKSGSA